MKHLTLIALFLCASVLNLNAAVPLKWTVETTRVQPATFDVVRGETIDLEASFNNAGKPFAMDGYDCSIFWQTNGMGSAWWTAPAAAASNRVSATFTPEMDPGASTVIGFLGSTGQIYRASFQLRFRHGPGATPNALPLPVPVIDFAKVRVLNPPWSGGGGVDTNAVREITREEIEPATNRLYKALTDAMPDGAARPLPKYLWLYNADDSYPDAAAEYYRSRGDGKTDGGCSSVRDGGILYRNFDFPFDDRAEFVVRMSAGFQQPTTSNQQPTRRYASVGVAQVGTNLTEQIVTSGKWSKWYKALPGATVDGINENGVACNINVASGTPAWRTNATNKALHPLAAVRWILDNATNAQSAAEYIAANIRFPQGWDQNFHYMICDPGVEETYVVENGQVFYIGGATGLPVMTNFNIVYKKDTDEPKDGQERLDLLSIQEPITNAWYTNAYRRETNPPWVSDLADVIDYTNEIFNAWAAHPKEYFRGQTSQTSQTFTWWQTVHTSVYDLTNRVLRVAVQETDDWYVFQVPSSGAKIDAYTKAETDAKFAEKTDLSADNVSFEGEMSARGPTVDSALKGLASELYTQQQEFSATKANKVSSATLGNLASLTDTGDLADSGKKPSDFRGATDNTCYRDQLGNIWTCNPPLPAGYKIVRYSDGTGWEPELNGNPMGAGKQDPDNTATTLSWAANEWQGGYAFTATRGAAAREDEVFLTEGAISSTDPTFSNAVDQIVRSLMPTTLRAYDSVRQCWWNIQPVNGVLTLTVED